MHELAYAQRPTVLVAEVMSYGQGSMVFAPYGSLWRSLRKICIFELLSLKRVQFLRSVREEVGKLRQTVSEGDTVVVEDGITGTVVEVPFLAGQHLPSESSSS
ncbi:hypothetical protein C1H46_028391 [Malus baccata]|uniref:Cytochrome P450 n=1 Tax=Malus baccata TaxID=106549 RepID=A0A540LIB4_MALBA|nr:hypothetical protein C1H46_028391 [Malus baccata]